MLEFLADTVQFSIPEPFLILVGTLGASAIGAYALIKSSQKRKEGTEDRPYLVNVVEVLQNDLDHTRQRAEEDYQRFKQELASMQTTLDAVKKELEESNRENRSLRSLLKKYQTKFGKDVV